MAFKMNRPVIKGTPLHKTSIAKATSESIVAQTRTQADGSLVGAGQTLGKSYIPAAIDYSIDSKAIKMPKNLEKKKEKEEIPSEKETIEVQDPTGKSEATLKGMTDQAVAGTGEETSAGEGYVAPTRPESIKVKTPKPTKEPGQYVTQEDLDKANAEARVQYDERRKAGDVSESGKIWDGKRWLEKSIYDSISIKSPVEMRDNRIYRNALKDGPVRRNMIKGGYKPQN